MLDEALGKKTQESINDEVKKSFWWFLQNLIDRMESGSRMHLQKNTPIAAGTIANIKNLRKHLSDFEKYSRGEIDFTTINMQFYFRFTEYLTEVKKINVNTIGKIITDLKVVMREALEAGYTGNTIFTHRKFKSTSAETDQIYLKA